jgi:carbon starvation protein
MFAVQGIFYETTRNGIVLHAMPLLLLALCMLAIAYRYYSAFLAARVAALDDSRVTPAHRFNDGQNYHPTNQWVLFGHHFAAISGAGPLIGPVLALQYGYMPGLLWLVIGVCLAGAVQDMLVLAASVRRGGKSLAEIARTELGTWANIVVSAAILFIVVIALAGLGAVVVKALGGEEVKLPEGTLITLPEDRLLFSTLKHPHYGFPAECRVQYPKTDIRDRRPEAFFIRIPADAGVLEVDERGTLALPAGSVQVVPGSSWGTFTIACTIPIALFVGLYMYRLRKGHVVEASVIGALATLAAVVAGNWIPGSMMEPFFSLTREQTILALAGYGFVASVLPVWLLLCPRDYLSSFLKIGTIALLVVGVFVANPVLRCPQVNPVFANGGPTFPWGGIFPFVFICIMCGAVSGFHALVSSGTTPKMIDRESHVRPIGYGAMLMEGLVGIVALITAASLDPGLYYDINVDLSQVPRYQKDIKLLLAGAEDLPHLDPERRNLGRIEERVGGESLRGRTGGAVTLAVGMANILTDALAWTGASVEGVMKYWYHFAIMFEALFILTTIDTGTRIGRFLFQEVAGRIYQPFEKTDWLPGSVLATLVVTGGWSLLVYNGSIETIWPMFGVANQLLAVIALCLVTTLLINTGRARYALVTLLPMLFVTTTTLSAGALMMAQFVRIPTWHPVKTALNVGLMLFVMTAVAALLLLAVARWLAVLSGVVPVKPEEPAGPGEVLEVNGVAPTPGMAAVEGVTTGPNFGVLREKSEG